MTWYVQGCKPPIAFQYPTCRPHTGPCTRLHSNDAESANDTFVCLGCISRSATGVHFKQAIHALVGLDPRLCQLSSTVFATFAMLAPGSSALSGCHFVNTDFLRFVLVTRGSACVRTICHFTNAFAARSAANTEETRCHLRSAAVARWTPCTCTGCHFTSAAAACSRANVCMGCHCSSAAVARGGPDKCTRRHGKSAAVACWGLDACTGCHWSSADRARASRFACRDVHLTRGHVARVSAGASSLCHCTRAASAGERVRDGSTACHFSNTLRVRSYLCACRARQRTRKESVVGSKSCLYLKERHAINTGGVHGLLGACSVRHRHLTMAAIGGALAFRLRQTTAAKASAFVTSEWLL